MSLKDQVNNLSDDVKERIGEVIENLFLFYNNFVTIDYVDSEKIKSPHIKILSKALEDIKTGKFERLCVAMPPSA